jgi:hypothetical protein
MSQAIPNQHPAVVLRTHYNHLRALLATAMIAVIGLTIALVLVASRGDTSAARVLATPAASVPASTSALRYDGGPEEGTSGPAASKPRPPAVRYDGGPEEGTSDAAR